MPLWREAVGEQLRLERRRQGRLLRELAEASGISQQYLSEIERGLKDPSSEMLQAHAEVLDLTLGQLTSRASRSVQSLHRGRSSESLELVRSVVRVVAGRQSAPL